MSNKGSASSSYLVDSQDFSRLPMWRKSLTSSGVDQRQCLTTSAWFSRRIILPLLLFLLLLTAYHSYQRYSKTSTLGYGELKGSDDVSHMDQGPLTGDEFDQQDEDETAVETDDLDEELVVIEEDEGSEESTEGVEEVEDDDIDKMGENEAYEPNDVELVNDDADDEDALKDEEIISSGDGNLPDDEGEDDDFDEITEENSTVSLNKEVDTVTQQPWFESHKNPGLEGIKLIHVNSYQRSGSSFIGKMFDVYKPSFFVYEPLEMMYTALFGVHEDNVVPHNIFFDHEARIRNMTEIERKMAYWTMDKIYHCQMSSYPVSMLLNVFWSKFIHFMSVGEPYVACLESQGISMKINRDTLTKCQAHISDACAPTFSTLYPWKLEFCQSVLFQNGTWLEDTPDSVWNSYKNTKFYQYKDNFQKYFECLRSYADIAKECAVEHLDKVCLAHEIRAVKTVRGPMELSEDFIKTYDQFSTVHLYRDPRGVTFSRMKANWSYAVFEDNQPKTLAKTYCMNVWNELLKLNQIKSEYPGRLLSLLHDEVLDDVIVNINNLFSELNLTVTDEVRVFIGDQLKMARRDRWKINLPLYQIREIEKACEPLFAITPLEAYIVTPENKRQYINQRTRLLQSQQRQQKLPKS